LLGFSYLLIELRITKASFPSKPEGEHTQKSGTREKLEGQTVVFVACPLSLTFHKIMYKIKLKINSCYLNKFMICFDLLGASQ